MLYSDVRIMTSYVLGSALVKIIFFLHSDLKTTVKTLETPQYRLKQGQH